MLGRGIFCAMFHQHPMKTEDQERNFVK